MTHVHSLFGPVLEGFTKGPTMIEDTKATTDNVLDRLWAERDRVTDQIAALDRQRHEIEAAIADVQGDDPRATWHRLAAKDDPGAHAAWVRLMATMLVRSGVPIRTTDSKWDSEIAAEAERLRAESGAATT